MAAEPIGEASIRIIADTSKFKPDLNRQLSGALNGVQADVTRTMGKLGDSVKSGMGAASKTVAGTKFELPTPDSRSFVGSIADAGTRSAQALGRTLVHGVGAAASSAANVMHSTLVAGATVVGGAVATALVTGFARFTTIQDATASLTISLGSAAKAADLLGSVLKVVKGTPFNLDQFARGAQTMVAMGVAAEKVPALLTAIGDASATQGSQANDFAQRLFITFGQISAQGRIMGEDLLQLSSTGVNALAILGNHFGKSAKDMQNMISKGAVPAQDAISILAAGIESGTHGIAGTTVALGGTMKKLGDTLSGSKENLGAAVARFGATIITPFQGLLTKGFQTGTAIFDAFGAKFKAVFASLDKGTVLRAFQHIFELLDSLPAKVGPLIDKFSQFSGVLGGLGGAGAGAAISSIAGALGPLGALLPDIGPLGGAIAGIVLASKDLRSVFADLLKTVLPVVNALGKQLAPVLESIVHALTPVIAVLADAAGSIFKALGPALVTVVTALGTVFKSLAPILTVIARVVSNILTPVFRILAPVIGQVATILGGALTDVLVKLSPVLDQIGQVLAQSIVKVVEALAPVLPELATAFAEIAVALGDLLVALLPIILPLIKFQTLIMTKISAPTMVLIAKAVALLATGVALLAQWLAKVISPLVKFFDVIGSKAGDALGFVVDQLKDVSKWLKDPLGGIKKLGSALDQGLSSLPNKLGSALTKATDKVVAFGKDLGPKLGRAIGAGITTAVNAFKDFGPKAAAALAAAPGLVGAAIANIFPKAVDAVSTAIDNLVGFFKGLPGRVSAELTSLPSTVGGFISGAAQKIDDFIADTPGKFKGLGAAIAKNMGDIGVKVHAIIDNLPTIAAVVAGGTKKAGERGGLDIGAILGKLPGQAKFALARLGQVIVENFQRIGLDAMVALAKGLTKGVPGVVIGIAALPSLLVGFFQDLPTRLGNISVQIIATLKNLPVQVGVIFANLFPRTTALLGRAAGGLVTVFSRLVPQILASLARSLPGLLNFFAGLGAKILAALSRLPGQLIAFFASGALWIIQGFVAGLPVLAGWLGRLGRWMFVQLEAGIGWLVAFGLSIPGAILRGINGTLNVIARWGLAFGGWLAGLLYTGLPALLAVGARIPGDILSGILRTEIQLAGWAIGLGGKIAGWLSDGLTAIEGWGGQIIGAIVRGIKASGGEIADAISSVVPGPLKSVLKHTPLGAILGNARGGPLLAGQVSWVGERGKELFVAPQSGFVISHGQSMAIAREAAASRRPIQGLASGTGGLALSTAPAVTVNINVVGVSAADAQLVGARIAPQVKAAVQAAVRANS